MAPLHSFGQDNQNEVQNDISGHVMHFVLALTSCDADGTDNGIIAFICS